jgi:hypothetical protein
LAVAAAVVGLKCLCFLPGPQAAPVLETEHGFNPALAASTALPVMMMAEGAEAKYGDVRKWYAVLVPLTTLILPGVAFGCATLWVLSGDAFWQIRPNHPKYMEREKDWEDHPWNQGTVDNSDVMNGLINRDDWEKGLEEAWEAAKPAGSTVTVQEKLKQLSTQNNPHFQPWKKNKALSA